jgi:RNase P subunit RPR2
LVFTVLETLNPDLLFSSRVRMPSLKVVWTCKRCDTIGLKERKEGKEEGKKEKERKEGTKEGKKKGMCTE